MHAAAWAADIAEARRVPLVLVLCLEESRYSAHHDDKLVETVLAQPDRLAAVRIFRSSAADLRRRHPILDIETRLLPGFPGTALVEASSSASLVVVGGDRSAAGRFLVGSTVRQVAGSAACPVAVWRQSRRHVHAQRMPVIVGVDGTPAGDNAIAHAFEYAAMTGAPLQAVHTWRGGDAGTEEARMSETLAAWTEKYPDVAVSRILRQGNPGTVLAELAQRARLVVIGSHAHNKLMDTVLGSTGQRLVHIAPCPILICRRQPRSCHTDCAPLSPMR